MSCGCYTLCKVNNCTHLGRTFPLMSSWWGSCIVVVYLFPSLAPDRFSTESVVRVNDGQKGAESEQTRGGESNKCNLETKETENPDKLVFGFSQARVTVIIWGCKQVSHFLVFLATSRKLSSSDSWYGKERKRGKKAQVFNLFVWLYS